MSCSWRMRSSSSNGIVFLCPVCVSIFSYIRIRDWRTWHDITRPPAFSTNIYIFFVPATSPEQNNHGIRPLRPSRSTLRSSSLAIISTLCRVLLELVSFDEHLLHPWWVIGVWRSLLKQRPSTCALTSYIFFIIKSSWPQFTAHEYCKVDGNVATIGITDFAQSALGDIVFVDLPEVGKWSTAAVCHSIAASVSTHYQPPFYNNILFQAINLTPKTPSVP